MRKLREMLAAQMQAQAQQASRLGPRGAAVPHGPGPPGYHAASSRGPGTGHSDEVEEMRERVRELETQLAERERLIESLDILRREREVERELHEAEQALDEAVAMREQRLRERPARTGYTGTGTGTGTGGGAARAGAGGEEGERSTYYHIEERSVWEDDAGVDRAPPPAPPGGPPPLRGSTGPPPRGLLQQVSPLSADSAAPSSFSSSSHQGVHASADFLRKSILSAPGPGQQSEPSAATRRATHLNISPTRPPPSAPAAASQPSARSLPVVVLSDDTVDVSLPRVINLNQDPLFSECLVYYVPEGAVAVGSKEADADIVLSGPDIMPRHCVMNHSADGRVVLHAEPEALVFVNGDVLAAGAAGRRLTHHDRVAFGRFHLFRFEASGQGSAGSSASSNSSSSSSNIRNGADKSKGRNGAGRHSVRWEDEVGADTDARRDARAHPAPGPGPGPVPFPTADTPARQPPDWEFAQQELMIKNEAIILRRSADQPLSALLAAAAAAAVDGATAAAATTATAAVPAVAVAAPVRVPADHSSTPVKAPRGGTNTTARSPTSSPQGSSKHLSPPKEPLVSPEVNPFATQPQTSAANAGLNPFADVNLPPLTAAGESHLDVAEWQSVRRGSLLAAAAAAAPRGSTSPTHPTTTSSSSSSSSSSSGSGVGPKSQLGKAVAGGAPGNDASPSSVASSSLASVASTASGARIMLTRPKGPTAPPQSGLSSQPRAGTAAADDAAAAAGHWAAIGRATQRRESNNPFDSPAPADPRDRGGWEVVVETSTTAAPPPPKPSAEPSALQIYPQQEHLSPVKSPLKSPLKSPNGAAGRSPLRASANGDAPASFEKEAALLSEELALMQQQLQERMKRYQVLTSFQFPPS